MEYKLFLDTNALLNLQQAAFKEPFVISQKTLEEIENIKTSGKKDGEVKYKARLIAHLLDENFGEYEVVRTTSSTKDVIESCDLEETPDNIILASAYLYNKDTSPIIFCTDDLNCKFLAKNIFALTTKGVNEINLVKNIDESKMHEIYKAEQLQKEIRTKEKELEMTKLLAKKSKDLEKALKQAKR